jgi:hypothetical protein
MRKTLSLGIALGLICGLVTGCSADRTPSSAEVGGQAAQPELAASAHAMQQRARSKLGRIAHLADDGSLVRYAGQAPVRKGVYLWHPVQLSEDAALLAVKDGSLVVNTPDGKPVRLRYERHIEHADGNWTWIGRPEGAAPGVEAILTFGEKAVFGSIPDGSLPALQLTTFAGRTWMVQRSPGSLASQSEAPVDGDAADYLAPTPKAAARTALLVQAGSAPAKASIGAQAATASTANNAVHAPTIDLLIGYTTALQSRLGGKSQVLTRMDFLVDLGNEAYSNSHISGRVRLLGVVWAGYADDTPNSAALFDLSGLQCTDSTGPGQHHLPDRDVDCMTKEPSYALRSLLAARESAQADLVALVRVYHQPENQTCGLAWVLGGGRQAIGADSAALGFAVVSDSSGTQFPSGGSTCPNETLVHELGHNMGLAHDRATAAGTDDTNTDGDSLDPEEYGRFAYSFGHSADATHGNFYTIMSQRRGTQEPYRVFSNPRIATCGGFACGVAGVADNALTLEQTMPVIAAFRGVPYSTLLDSFTDINGDGRDDIFWTNARVNSSDWWLMNGVHWTYGHGQFVNGQYRVVGRGDFDGDGRSDILWEDSAQLWIWHSEAAGGFSAQLLGQRPGGGWEVAGVADFNGDGRDDIFWVNSSRSSTDYWLMNGNHWTDGSGTPGAGRVVALGDFDGDGRCDVMVGGSSALWLWHSEAAGGFTQQYVGSASPGWFVVGAKDLNGDGRADLFWSNPTKQSASWWLMNGAHFASGGVKPVPYRYHVVGLGDFDGDRRGDVLWEDGTEMYIWHSEATGGFSTQFLAKQPAIWAPML